MQLDQIITTGEHILSENVKDPPDIRSRSLNQNVDGTSLDQVKKQYYDSFLLQNQYGLGDVVLKLDSAKNIGHSPKLKREYVVHHDRIKLCKD
jgi:hypothetical protein